MRIVRKGEFPGTRADLEVALADYRQALSDHKSTEGVPAPFPEYEILRELAPLPDNQWMTEDEIPDDKDPPPTLTYRDKRAVDYRDELGEETGSFVVTLGDVMDDMIDTVEAAHAALQFATGTDHRPAAFKSLLTKRAAIKARHPRSE